MNAAVQRARAALEGVTEGPWEVNPIQGNPAYHPFYGVCVAGEKHRRVVFAQSDYAGYGNGSRKADAEFIAQARDLVPELAEAVELRDKVIEAMADQLELWLKNHPVTGPRQEAVASLILQARRLS